MGRNLASTELHRIGQKWWRKLCQELIILGIKKKILARAGLLRGRTLAVEAQTLQREHVWLPRALKLRSPTLPGTAVVGRGSKEAVAGLGEGGRGHTRHPRGAGPEWKANMLLELLRAPHCPRDAPDCFGRSGREQVLCSSSSRSRAKARPPRVCTTALNPSHCWEQATAWKWAPCSLGSSSARA